MRIISGSARGHRLKTLATNSVRPTADRVREAIFNILGTFVEGVSVLDLYAGFGAFGLEALSRGAQHVHFVEKDRKVSEIIKTNLEALHFENANVLCLDAFRALDFLMRKNIQFNLVFADPPYRLYEKAWINELWEKIDKVLLKEGLLVIEHPSGWVSPTKWGSLEKQDSRKYGQTEISFYKSK